MKGPSLFLGLKTCFCLQVVKTLKLDRLCIILTAYFTQAQTGLVQELSVKQVK